MSGHEVMVQRITTIVAELYQHGFVSRQQLMDQFTISERTLYRDLNRLGDRITHDGNGIYRLSPAYAKTQSLKELQNLARAQQSLNHHFNALDKAIRDGKVPGVSVVKQRPVLSYGKEEIGEMVDDLENLAQPVSAAA